MAAPGVSSTLISCSAVVGESLPLSGRFHLKRKARPLFLIFPLLCLRSAVSANIYKRTSSGKVLRGTKDLCGQNYDHGTRGGEDTAAEMNSGAFFRTRDLKSQCTHTSISHLFHPPKREEEKRRKRRSSVPPLQVLKVSSLFPPLVCV